MKNTIGLFVLLIPFFCSTYAQDSLNLKMQYSPETIYVQTVENISKTEIKYSGTEEFLKKMKDNGQKNPTITDQQFKVRTILKVGKSINGSQIPLTIKFINLPNAKLIIPDGIVIFGHIKDGKMPALDSAASTGLEKQAKMQFLESTQSLIDQVRFPEKRMKVGESFSIETSISKPMYGIILNITTTTNYKLLNIVNGVGNFDIDEISTIKTIETKYTMKGSGSGRGKMEWDINHNFYLNYQIDSDEEVNIKNDNYSIDTKAHKKLIRFAEITKIPAK